MRHTKAWFGSWSGAGRVLELGRDHAVTSSAGHAYFELTVTFHASEFF